MARDWFLVLAAVALTTASQTGSADQGPLLLRYPTANRTHLVFNYASDLWIVPRTGGEATRLTAGNGSESLPAISPDGSTVAFTGEYDGNRDVFLVPVTGGVPRRLTFHPADESVRGWSPDGQRVLYSSAANSFYHDESQLYTVSTTGGFPEPLPVPSATEASLSPDGTHIAYVPHAKWQEAWKRYRGGQTTPVWIMDLKDSSIKAIPRENSNDHHPIWVGQSVYFLSDRAGPVSLFVYDTTTGVVKEALHSDGLDFKSISAAPDAVVIEQFGAIKLYDTATHTARNVTISIHGDLPQVRPHYAKVNAAQIRNFGLSPTGARAVFEERGDIYTVPTEQGDIRNLTRSTAIADRDPSWSPDGTLIAYFSDESGEYELCLRRQDGLGEIRHIRLDAKPSYYYEPVWSPDGTRIAYTDKKLNLWYVTLSDQRTTHVDTTSYASFGRPHFDPTWSPDSKWLGYSKQLASGLSAMFVYSLQTHSAHMLSDGMSDVRYPAFDINGKLLYFTASTNVGLTVQGLDMSSNEHRVTRSVYVAVLAKDAPSPLAPPSDEEPAPKTVTSTAKPCPNCQSPDAAKASPVSVTVDLEGMAQRILSLPIPARNYTALTSPKTGVLLLGEAPEVQSADAASEPLVSVWRFEVSKKKLDKLLENVSDYTVSRDGLKLLYKRADAWTVAATDETANGAPKPGFGPLKLDGWETYVDPRAVWRQIYAETWRIERDFLYDPNHHGLDLAKAAEKYRPYLSELASRDELTYLLNEALGELTIGHMFVNGGDGPVVERVKGGLLGADYRLENGRYRFARVYDGENWNPELQAPLTPPGVNVHAGDYLLAINGRELTAAQSVYGALEGTANRQTVIRVGATADGKNARDVTVVPLASETALRNRAWIEANRRRVDEATGGRVAYAYVPNTGGGGYTSFNRYFFPQVGKEALILDERYNEGGQIADYIVDLLRRPLMSKVTTREGLDWSSPSQAIYGPKVLLINEMSGSGGDALPWYFRKAGLGPLVGKRTWGGLVGIGGYPELIDGGSVTAPSGAIYGLDGQWEVENQGIAPDIDVERDPALVRLGRDPQLEAAIAAAMQALTVSPQVPHPKPPYPNYHTTDGLGVH